MSTITLYGHGGFDPTMPNNNIVSVTEVEEPDSTQDDDPLLTSIAAMTDEQKAALREALGI